MSEFRRIVGRITTDQRAQFTVIVVALVLSHGHAQAVQDSIAAGGLVGVFTPRKKP